ncbi:Predicted HD superfamily hydrolase [Klebsiella pneumoniae]|uniref:hypothetical protein n=1 Tax=Klebsiella pneumoniae TaxID=573 RepID=UPI000E2CA210|nr:hypothetical protein [Klebsiella pneumoniae]SVR37893.1 Predicted HD superfamily hydrolase [Klebsiella pneumoniae]
MKILVLEFLKKHWLACILIAAAAVAGMNIGRIAEEHRKDENLQAAQKENARLNTKVTDLNELRRREAEEKAAALAEAWRKQADIERERDQLARELQQQKNELEKKKNELKKAISDAVKGDVGFTGIGPRGLCLYNSALGYPCDNRLQATTDGTAGRIGKTSGSGGGLSPEGLLNHSSDYGAWCQKLESQLIKLGAWYDREGK